MKVELIQKPKNLDLLEYIACVCYDSQPTPDHKILKSCITSGHLSILEHICLTFKIECSRACSHQLVRHRTAKPTQRSQRYCSESGFSYETPTSISNDGCAEDVFKDTIDYIQSAYDTLTQLGVKAEDARSVLPNACETKIIMTFDLRNLLHFFNERLCTRAQSEIREIATKMKNLVVEAFPELSPYCVPKCEIHEVAFCPEGKGCGRHKTLKEITNG